MSPFKKLAELERQAKEWGFYWPTAESALEQIQSECEEIKEELRNKPDPVRLQEEIGDLIQATLSLCIFCAFDQEETLTKSLEKFEKRFKTLIKLMKEEGYSTAQGQSVETLSEFWKKAKALS